MSLEFAGTHLKIGRHRGIGSWYERILTKKVKTGPSHGLCESPWRRRRYYYHGKPKQPEPDNEFFRTTSRLGKQNEQQRGVSTEYSCALETERP